VQSRIFSTLATSHFIPRWRKYLNVAVVVTVQPPRGLGDEMLGHWCRDIC
jgi:hypothetical protein